MRWRVLNPVEAQNSTDIYKSALYRSISSLKGLDADWIKTIRVNRKQFFAKVSVLQWESQAAGGCGNLVFCMIGQASMGINKQWMSRTDGLLHDWSESIYL